MSGGAEPTQKTAIRGGAAGEVLAAFLRLGLTWFGGPVAHLGYFREEFVAAAAGSTTGLCRPRGALPVPAGAGEQQGRHRDRPVARRLAGRAGGMGGLHPALGHRLVLFAYGVDRARRRSRRLAARAQGRRRRGRGAGRAGDDARARARPRARDARGGRGRARAGGAVALGQVGAIVARRRRRLVLLRGGPARCTSACRMPVAGVAIGGDRACSSCLLVGLPLLVAAAPNHDLRAVRRVLSRRARWCSAAATSCCRCCRPRSCRRAGSATTLSSPATAPRRRCPARCSRSPPISAP